MLKYNNRLTFQIRTYYNYNFSQAHMFRPLALITNDLQSKLDAKGVSLK